MSSKPHPHPNPQPQLHHSIPGYNPSKPLLTRGNKLMMASLIVGPAITYGLMKLRQQRLKEAEKQLEVEGRVQWDNTFGKGTTVADADVHKGGEGA